MVTKTQTRTIFDRNKIAPGDVVEVPLRYFGKFWRVKEERIVGVVQEVIDERIKVYAADCFNKDGGIQSWVYEVDDAEEITVIKRNPFVKRTEDGK